MNNIVIAMLVMALLLHQPANAQDSQEHYDADCQPLRIEGKHGPFDYRNTPQVEKDRVERVHFNEHYQAYKNGKVGKFKKKHDSIYETPAAGFGYTLWAFPNHYHALSAIEDIGYKQKTEKLDGLALRIHCYFQRAARHVPNDGLVKALYGYYYARRQLSNEAERELVKAIDLQPDNINVLNYVATAYLEMGNIEKAVEYARQVYAAGYPFPGLRSRIEKAGGTFE